MPAGDLHMHLTHCQIRDRMPAGDLHMRLTHCQICDGSGVGHCWFLVATSHSGEAALLITRHDRTFAWVLGFGFHAA